MIGPERGTRWSANAGQYLSFVALSPDLHPPPKVGYRSLQDRTEMKQRHPGSTVRYVSIGHGIASAYGDRTLLVQYRRKFQY
eukprot:947832-Rhodomonas_salina.2